MPSRSNQRQGLSCLLDSVVAVVSCNYGLSGLIKEIPDALRLQQMLFNPVESRTPPNSSAYDNAETLPTRNPKCLPHPCDSRGVSDQAFWRCRDGIEPPTPRHVIDHPCALPTELHHTALWAETPSRLQRICNTLLLQCDTVLLGSIKPARRILW